MKDETFIIIAVGAAVVFALLWFVKHMKTLQVQRQKGLSAENIRQATFPLRMQAYERLTILLERMSPEELLLRYNGQADTVGELQLTLLSAIRSEYEHNAAQQLYVTPALWQMISDSRNTLLTLINQSALGLPSDAPAYQLSKRIMDNVAALATLPTSQALEALRKEAQSLYNRV